MERPGHPAKRQTFAALRQELSNTLATQSLPGAEQSF
jgi:hypothetical protein